ncbi:MAG: PDZ domain-containing protein [Gemmatimonadota bacterium]|nr:PDZ domain-containing protein [Gemmatimonadota bacterium]
MTAGPTAVSRPLAAPRPAGSRGFVRGLLVPAVATVSGAVLPVDGVGQDTAGTAGSAWIGIRFELAARGTSGPGRGTGALVVRDVYGNGPADRVGIRPGDRFVAVNGSTLPTYEAWLRSTSDLGPGTSLSVRLFRDSGEREVTVVAGRRPSALVADPLYRLEWEMARLDSLFGLFLAGGPPVERWARVEVPLEPRTRMRSESEARADAGGRAPVRAGRRPGGESEPEPRAWATLLPGRTVAVVLGGAVVRDLTAELGRYFGVGAGVLVTDVVDASTPAAQAGFRPGDIIVSVEDRKVESLPAFRRVLAGEHSPVKITVVRRKSALKLAYPNR